MLINELKKFLHLSIRERQMFVQAVLLLPLIHLSLCLLGYHRLHKITEKLIPIKEVKSSPSEADNTVYQAKEITRIVAIGAEHGFFQASCLRRTFLDWVFLRRNGIQSSICFGVRRIGQQLEAHAWLEYEGIVINDVASVQENYLVLCNAFPPTQAGL
jgi:hypothetical protein